MCEREEKMSYFKISCFLVMTLSGSWNGNVQAQNTSTTASPTVPPYTTVAPFITVAPSPTLAPANKAPVLAAGASNYVIINQTVAGGTIIHSINAQDPEKGSLFFSIIGVTYYRNGTNRPIIAYNESWAAKKPPNKGDNLCTIAQTYPFPRNLFCMDPASNAVKVTSKYRQRAKADFSLFRLDVAVFDNGSPQMNLTTKVYVRIKENCTIGVSEHIAYQMACRKYLPVLALNAQRGEIGHTVSAPNNSVISRVVVTFPPNESPGLLGKEIEYSFSYYEGRVNKLHTFTRRLLINTTVERSLSIHMWWPITISSSIGIVPVTFSTKPAFSQGASYQVFMFNKSTNYCADDACVTLWKKVEDVSGKYMKYECTRKDASLLLNKYAACEALPKPPVWKNVNQNYVFINKTSPAGTSAFSFQASDPVSSSTVILYSILGVTYYRNDTSTPVSRFSQSWAQTVATTSDISRCKMAESLPFPRNLFCINFFENTIKTTEMFLSSLPLMSSLYVLDVLMAIDGKPGLNTTGKVYIRIKRNCSDVPSLAADWKTCQTDVQQIDIRGSFKPVSVFNFTANNVSLHKITFLSIAFLPFSHIGKLITITITDAITKAVVKKEQRWLYTDPAKEVSSTVDIQSTRVLNGQFSLTVAANGTFLTASQGADYTAIQIFTLPPKNFCSNLLCRRTYNKLRIISDSRDQRECLTYETNVLADAKYGSCPTVFTSKPKGSTWVKRDLANGTAILTETTISNHAVFYSIIGVSYWQNDSSPSASIAKNKNWVVKTRLDADRSCSVSVDYPFPRNLFCISRSGVLMTTSQYRNKLQPFSFVAIDLRAANSKNATDYANKQVFLNVQPSAADCEPFKQAVISMFQKCNSMNPTIYPVQQKSNFYQFTAPAKASLLIEIVVQPSTILANLKAGEAYSFVLTRPGGITQRINKTLLVPRQDRESVGYINSSLYRNPIVLSPSEEIFVAVYSSAGILKSNRTKILSIITVPNEQYCLTSCFDSYNSVVTRGGKVVPRFPCSNHRFDGKYGRCLSNSPPSLSVRNIVMPGAVASGSSIGRITGSDKEGSPLTYGIQAIYSTLLKRNRSRTLVSGQPCVEAIKEEAPLNYLCVSNSTGELSVTSKFPQTPGEVLVVTAFVIDGGSPRRYSKKTFTVSIFDLCQKPKVLYRNATSKTCFVGGSTGLSPQTTTLSKKVSISGFLFDNILVLEISQSAISFPRNTMYSVFTLQVVMAVEPSRKLGEKFDYVYHIRNNPGKGVQIPVYVPVYAAVAVEISAIAVTNASALPTTTKPTSASATTTSAASNATTAAVYTLPPLTNVTHIIKPLRKRRMVSAEAPNINHTTNQLVNVTLLLNKDSLLIHGHSFKSACGNAACVIAFNAWKEEARKTGHKICQSDPLRAGEYYMNCSDPPRFSKHPLSVKTKLKSSVSVSCSFQNFTSVTFQWMKDGKIYTPPLEFPRREHREFVDAPSYTTTSSAKGSSVKATSRTLFLNTNDPEMQGYYSCYVKDALNHVVTSQPSLLRLSDVSSSKIKMRIKKTFTNALRNTNSSEYKKFVSDVTSTLNSKLDKSGLPSNRKIVLSNIRSGSVLVDANVYFLNVSDSNAKRSVCNGLKNISAVRSTSELEVSSLELIAYDCCYSSQTGETQLKGIISWLPVPADSFDTRPCPYVRQGLQKNAFRNCSADFNKGAQWMQPNITACPYKTKTTQKLEKIAQTKIDSTNAKAISSELDTVTSSTSNITNRLDIKFTADTINNLVQSKQKLSQITNDIINTTSNIMDVSPKIIGSAQANYNSSAKMLSSLELLANSVPVSPNNTFITVRKKNVALAIKSISSRSGLLIKATSGKRIGYNNLTITSSPLEEKGTRDSTATIYLSSEMLHKVSSLNRVFSFVFENSRLFSSRNAIYNNKTEMKKVDSRILSATVGDVKLQNLSYNEEVTGLFDRLSTEKGEVECVFWDFTLQDGFGAWSSNGCRSDGMQGNLHRCRCNHLTNFAILLDVTGKGTPTHAALALSVVTYIGCGISLVCLIITFLTFVIFKKLRKPLPPKILICLCFALIVTLIIFLAGIAAKDLKSCQAVGVLIHYFVLVSFCWMAVEGFNLYLSFVKIVNSRVHKFILKSSVFAWGVPAVIVAITAGVTELEAYGKKNGDEWLCMITGTPFYVAYLTPILVIVVANLVVLVYVLRSLNKSSQMSKDKKMTGLTQVRIAAACSVLMGTTWIIGLFAIDVLTLPVQVLFCLFNSLQGLFIFLFYCLRNADVRKQWKSICGIRERDGSKASSAQDYYKKGFGSDKAAATNKAFSNQSKKPNHDHLAMESFGKNTTLTSLQSTDMNDRTTFLRNSQLSEGVSPSNGLTIESNEKPKMYVDDTAEMTFGFEPVEISIKPIMSSKDGATQL